MDNEEIRIEELRVGNKILFGDIMGTITGLNHDSVIFTQGHIQVEDIDELESEFDFNIDRFEPLPLTKEILKNNLGFEVTDMGDFWQAEKEDFVLIQIKLSIGNMPFMFVLKSSIKESVNFYYVHHLQNTYLDLKGELLLWKS